MFDAWCDAEGRRVLLFPHNVTAIRNEADGIEVDFRCHCGAAGTWHTGRARTAA